MTSPTNKTTTKTTIKIKRQRDETKRNKLTLFEVSQTTYDTINNLVDPVVKNWTISRIVRSRGNTTVRFAHFNSAFPNWQIGILERETKRSF